VCKLVLVCVVVRVCNKLIGIWCRRASEVTDDANGQPSSCSRDDDDNDPLLAAATELR